MKAKAKKVETEAVVSAKCMTCGHIKEIREGEVPAGEHPMCPKDYGPMVPVRAFTRTKTKVGK